MLPKRCQNLNIFVWNPHKHWILFFQKSLKFYVDIYMWYLDGLGNGIYGIDFLNIPARPRVLIGFCRRFRDIFPVILIVIFL